MENNPIDVDVQKYIMLREKKSQLEAEHKKKLAVIDMFMEEIETKISAQALAEGVTGYKTEYGTVFFSEVARVNIADWGAILQWIQQNNAYDVLTKAVKKDAINSIVQSTGLVPPGLDYSRIRTFNCRKPTKD